MLAYVDAQVAALFRFVAAIWTLMAGLFSSLFLIFFVLLKIKKFSKIHHSNHGNF
jgi:hypothetical protein